MTLERPEIKCARSHPGHVNRANDTLSVQTGALVLDSEISTLSSLVNLTIFLGKTDKTGKTGHNEPRYDKDVT